MRIGRMTFLLAGVALLGAGCRGTVSSQPPIHLNPNMDQQSRFDAQEGTDFFPDGRAMRLPVEGTVAVGALHADQHLDHGQVDGQPAPGLPAGIVLDKALLVRGQERYAINCAPCHGLNGEGQGPVVLRDMGLVRPPTFHDARLRAQELGYFFGVMTNGVRSMPSYAAQVSVQDRWAIVAYLRTLQRSQAAPLDQVPADMAVSKGWK